MAEQDPLPAGDALPADEASLDDASSDDASSADASSADASSGDASSGDASSGDGAAPMGRAAVQETPARGDLEPRWLVMAGVLAMVFLALLLWGRPKTPPGARLATATVMPSAASELVALPTPETAPTTTPVPAAVVLPTSTPSAEAALVLPTATPTSLVLPTATPTTLPSELLQRRLDISGRISLTLTLQNASFQSDGRPLRFGVDRRTYQLNPGNPAVEEHWCQQLGMVHLRGDLRYTLDSSTGDVRADGSLKLISDFCDAPGAAQFIAPVSLLFPVDSVTPVVQELALSRRLFESPGLLDSQAAVGLELTVINSLAE